MLFGIAPVLRTADGATPIAAWGSWLTPLVGPGFASWGACLWTRITANGQTALGRPRESLSRLAGSFRATGCGGTGQRRRALPSGDSARAQGVPLNWRPVPHEPSKRACAYRKAPITSWEPTMANSSRMPTSSRLVYHALCGTASVHFTRLFKYSSVAARNGTNRLPTIV